MKSKPNLLTFKVNFKNVRGIKRATKALNKTAKALEKINESAKKATVAFREMSAAMPVLLEIETENDDEQITR